MSNKFRMKDLGESHVRLGMEIFRNRFNDTLSQCQSRYSEKVINRFGMCLAKGSVTPVDVGVEFAISDGSCDEPCREAIGSWMYFMVWTLQFSIGKLAKYVEHPGNNHCSSVERLLQYVIYTKHLGLSYGGTYTSLTPTAYVDAYLAGDQESRQSMGGLF